MAPGLKDSTQYFIVASHGWSASNWVAYALNLNPKITCAHSSAAIIANDPGRFDGDGLRIHLGDLRRGYVQRQTRSIDELYDELEKKHPSPVVGTVHTYRLRDLPVQEERFGLCKRSYRTVNLVRHPLDLVVSGYGQFLDLFRIDLNEFAWTLRKIVEQGLDIVEEICNRHNIAPGDHDVVCFFAACVVLGSLRLDLDALEQLRTKPNTPWDYCGTVRMEDITQSAHAFANLVKMISKHRDLTTDNYLDTVFKVGRVNIHNAQGSGDTSSRWARLADWQKEAFQAFLERFSLRKPYEQCGYDFGILDHT